MSCTHPPEGNYTEVLEIRVSPMIVAYIDQLHATGFFGTRRTQTIRILVMESLQRHMGFLDVEAARDAARADLRMRGKIE